MADREKQAGTGGATSPAGPYEHNDYGDPSNKMWSLYVKEAEKFDKDLVEDWKGTMDGILIFVRQITTSM